MMRLGNTRCWCWASPGKPQCHFVAPSGGRAACGLLAWTVRRPSSHCQAVADHTWLFIGRLPSSWMQKVAFLQGRARWRHLLLIQSARQACILGRTLCLCRMADPLVAVLQGDKHMAVAQPARPQAPVRSVSSSKAAAAAHTQPQRQPLTAVQAAPRESASAAVAAPQLGPKVALLLEEARAVAQEPGQAQGEAGSPRIAAAKVGRPGQGPVQR